jgi:hypothetical protein
VIGLPAAAAALNDVVLPTGGLQDDVFCDLGLDFFS